MARVPFLLAGIPTLLVSGMSLCAQAPASSDETDLMELLNTPISTASKKSERAIQAPSVTSLVTRDQVQAYGWTSLNDVLYSLPGFGPSQDYDRRTVSSRGLFEGWNNNHLLMLVDGIPFNDNIYGTAYTWEVTPLFLARTVEVVRGPGSALYGSNATNGVVQMKGISARDLRGVGEAQIRFGQNGERIFDFAVGLQSSLVSTVVGFNTSRTDGNGYLDYDGSGRFDGNGNLNKYWVDDARKSQYAWAKLEGEGALKGWNFQYHHQDWDYKTGHGWIWYTPDRTQGQYLQEKREIVALSYKGQIGANLEQEYMVRHQRHDLFWNTPFVPAGGAIWDYVLGQYVTMPSGVSEVLETGASDWFGRSQWSLNLPQGADLLFGIEATRFLYSGDRSHYGVNFDFNAYTTTNPNSVVPAGPFLEGVKDKPILSTGYYAQFSSGKLLGEKFKAVLGVRSDKTSFDYLDIADVARPTRSKSYANTSPRFALVFTPTETLAIKAMFGTAFRSPAPSEFAGANTYFLASNIAQLKPEKLSTTELAVDWIINANLNWRTNIYRTKFQDQIAYSLQNYSLSTNIYTLTTQGLETELLYGFGSWKGYLNYAIARRVDEEVSDTTIAPSKDKLTWEPGQRFKAGLIFTSGDFSASANLMYQGQVDRRSSDLGNSAFVGINVDPYRKPTVDAWFTLNAKVAYSFSKGSNISLMATNLLNTDKNTLVKNMAFPFDYKGPERQVSVVLKTTF